MLILPENYNYHQVSEKIFRIQEVEDEASAKIWLEEYSSLTKTTWRVMRTFPKIQKFNKYKIDYRCCHKTDRRITGQGPSKHTGCEAKLGITIKRFMKDLKNPNPLNEKYPCIINLHDQHNHISALKYRDLSPSVKEKFLDLFQKGHNASSALKIYKTELMLELGENYYEAAEDSKIMPTYSIVYKLFCKEGYLNPSNWILPSHDNEFSFSAVICQDDNEPIINCQESTIVSTSYNVSEDNQQFSTVEETESLLKLKQDTIVKLRKIFNIIEEKINTKPEIFLASAQKMIKNSLKFAVTENGLSTAMCTFGTFNGARLSLQQRKAKNILKKCHRSTAISCRKQAIAGKKPSSPGRSRDLKRQEDLLTHFGPYFVCTSCSKVFKTKNSFKQHQKMHSEDSQQCMSCGQLFRWRSTLLRHIKIMHK